MAPREFDLDLNLLPADWDLNDELDCDMVRRGDGETDGDELGVQNQGGGDSHDAASGRYNDPIGGHDLKDQVLTGALEHEDGTGHGLAAGEEGSSGKKRRFYSDDLKIAIYLELLAKTDPPVLRRGVSSQVARKFGVPLGAVQSVWRRGQNWGIDGVKNKTYRKRIEIDFGAIKAIPPSERTSFQKLANALGVNKSTLYNRFKEGYFIRTTRTKEYLV